MTKKIKIAYITVGENLNSELLIRQVVELLGDIKKKAQEFEIKVFSFQGILSIINHKNDNSETKKRLKKLGINFVVVPIVCPWPFPNFSFIKTDVGWRPNGRWNKLAVITFQLLSLPFMVFLRLFCGYKLFHCRSYPATSIAIFLKKLIPDTNVIFDPRSDYPEENLTAGVWKDGSKDFIFWKNAEKDFLESANAVACIGPTYVDHYKKNTSSFKYFIAPNNVKCDEFKRKEVDRDEIREKLGIGKTEHVYVYLGGMSSNGWHRPYFYVKLYDMLSKVSEEFKFLFIVPIHAINIVKESFGPRENIIVVSPKLSEVSKYLSASDYGMMFLSSSKIAVGTKIGEYLAASLPLIINANCIGAVALINLTPEIGTVVKLGLGDLDAIENFDSDDLNSIIKMTRSDDYLFYFSKSYFDNEKVANTYIQQYQNLNSCIGSK